MPVVGQQQQTAIRAAMHAYACTSYMHVLLAAHMPSQALTTQLTYSMAQCSALPMCAAGSGLKLAEPTGSKGRCYVPLTACTTA